MNLKYNLIISGAKSGGQASTTPAAGAPKSISGQSPCNQQEIPISTISNNNGIQRINSSANNTTIAEHSELKFQINPIFAGKKTCIF